MPKPKKKDEPAEAIEPAEAVDPVDAERDLTTIELLRELRARARDLKAMELAGALRTLLQERTDKINVDEELAHEGPAAPRAAPTGKKARA